MNKFLLFVSALCLAGNVYAQSVTIPYDMATVNADGVLDMNEWQNATQIAIRINTNDSVTVRMKHDMTAMYFAFTGKLESANALFPEVMFDPQEVKGNNWVNGQWWFHVSATDCESNGTYGDYGNCQLTQPDWQGVPNFTMGAPMTDTVEIKIPFSKIGFDPMTQSTMGIAFDVTNTVSTWKLWPATADHNIPATWAQAVISKFPVQITGTKTIQEIQAIPNPVSQALVLTGLQKGAVIRLYDIAGKQVQTAMADNEQMILDVTGIPAGVYLAEINTGGQVVIKKIIKQ